MKKKLFVTILQYIVFLGLGIAIIYYMLGKLTDEEKVEMIASIKEVRLWLLIPTLIVGFLSHYFRALRWKLMLEPLNIRPTTYNTTFAVLIGYIVNLAIPRAGEVAKCTVLARYEKAPVDKTIGTIVAERIFDTLCLGIITLAAFALQSDVIGDYALDVFGKIAGKKTSYMGMHPAFILLGMGAVFFLLLFFIYRRNKESKISRFIKGLVDGVRSIFKLEKHWQFFGYTVLIWGSYWFLLMIAFWSLPVTEHLSMQTALVVLVFGSVGMIVTQGGIGAYPYLIMRILQFYGIEIVAGQAFGWVSWTVQTVIILILGIISLILLPIYNRKPHNAQAAVDTK
jgi:uncharacterized membrane protein YbhN (UPF0104 family)